MQRMTQNNATEKYYLNGNINVLKYTEQAQATISRN
jgi:hypothetical protein